MADVGKDINLAVELLQQGEIVGIPTETVYGLAGNALNDDAVLKIFDIKQRPSFDPLIVHIKNAASMEELAHSVPQGAYSLADKLWPGPLTIILKKKDIVPDMVTSGLDTVGLRIPKHPMTLELLNALNFPLAAPSANPFGYISPTSAQHVDKAFGTRLKYILDGGPCSIGIESTVVSFTEEKAIVHRLGGMELSILESVLGYRPKQVLNKSSDPKAPGMLKSHYAPNTPFYLTDDLAASMADFSTKKLALISFKDAIDAKENNVNFVLSSMGDISEAAKNLFSIMRKADEQNADMILAEKVPEEGIGKAINDRLIRASTT